MKHDYLDCRENNRRYNYTKAQLDVYSVGGVLLKGVGLAEYLLLSVTTKARALEFLRTTDTPIQNNILNKLS